VPKFCFNLCVYDLVLLTWFIEIKNKMIRLHYEFYDLSTRTKLELSQDFDTDDVNIAYHELKYQPQFEYGHIIKGSVCQILDHPTIICKFGSCILMYDKELERLIN